MKIFTYIKDNSSRIEKKNFQTLGNLVLWKHLIYELASGGLEIFIDTDSKEILTQCSVDPNLSKVVAYARKNSHIKMETEDANKLSPSLLMIERFLNEHVDDEEEPIVLTHVTSPFLKKETILDAVESLKNNNYEYIHSVVKEKNFVFLKDFKGSVNFDPTVVQKTQDLETVYLSNGAFFVFTKKTFMRNKNRWGENMYFYPLTHLESVEIDYPDDLFFAEILYNAINNNSSKECA